MGARAMRESRRGVGGYGIVRGIGRPGDLVLTEAGDARHALVLVRGYLNRQRGRQRECWLASVRRAGFRGAVYEFAWDASTPSRFLTNVWRLNDWRQVNQRASLSGQNLLPAALHRLREPKISLIGASAGAVVVFHALSSPALAQSGVVHSAWLLGAALRRDRTSVEWEAVLGGLSGTLNNVYSNTDWVLSSLYPAVANGSQACGAGPIPHVHERLVNWDATAWLGEAPRSLAGHGNYARAVARLNIS